MYINNCNTRQEVINRTTNSTLGTQEKVLNCILGIEGFIEEIAFKLSLKNGKDLNKQKKARNIQENVNTVSKGMTKKGA